MKKFLLRNVPAYKATLSLILILLFCADVLAQKNIDSLEYAVDNIGYFGQANRIAISPAANVANLPFNVNITSVANGIHVLFVRTHSSTIALPVKGDWSQTNFTYFFKQNSVSAPVSTIVKLEYFIDTDPGEGNAIPINVAGGSAQVSGVSFNPNIGLLSNGFHVICIRSLDANGKWSITNYNYFYKQNNIPTLASTVVKLEYFIDTDPGEGNAIPINVAGGSVQVSGIVFNPNIGSLSNGFHVLFIRSLDANGKWGVTNYIYFYKQNNIPTLVSTVTKMEYFIDTDPGEGQGKPITFGAATNVSGLNFNADISLSAAGFHVLFIRSLDANGKWSITNYAYFSKAGPQTATAVNIIKIEYFIDTDPGLNNAINIPVNPPAPDIANKNFSANITGLSYGRHYLNIRSLDSRNKWSVTAIDSFILLNALPLRLINFNAVADGDNVNVTWQTGFEQNLKSFEIEYSVDGILFTKIGSVNPTNNQSGSSYLYKHFTPANGNNFYRLKTTEADGSIHYSDVKLVNFNRELFVKISPVPADKYFTIKTGLKNFSMNIFSADGKILKALQNLNGGVNVDVSNLPSGLYNVSVMKDKTISNTILVIKH